MKTKWLTDIEQSKKFFKEVIIETLIKDDNNVISWPNYSSGIHKKLYAKEYENLKQLRQYSLLLSNNSFVQMYYSFNSKGELLKAKLAYYPFPVILKEQTDDLENYYNNSNDPTIEEYYYDLWNLFQAELGKKIKDSDLDELKEILKKIGVSEHELLEQKFNSKYSITNTSHLRFDFDGNVTSHNKFEIQFSSLNTIRLPLKQVISPFVFLDFIIRHEFKDHYKSLLNNNNYIAAFKTALNNSAKIEKFDDNSIYLIHN